MIFIELKLDLLYVGSIKINFVEFARDLYRLAVKRVFKVEDILFQIYDEKLK